MLVTEASNLHVSENRFEQTASCVNDMDAIFNTCVANARCFVQFGSVDADASFFGGRSWLAVDGSHTSSTFTCSSLLTSPDPDESDEHHMWNPMLGLFSHVQIGVFMESYFDEVVLRASQSPVTLHSICYVTRLNFIFVQC